MKCIRVDVSANEREGERNGGRREIYTINEGRREGLKGLVLYQSRCE